MEFLGSFYRARLFPGGREEDGFLADFSINLVKDLEISEGIEITVWLPENRLLVFASD